MTLHVYKAISTTISAVLLLGCHGVASAAGDAVHGQTLYQTMCAVCHSIDYNGVGPAHKGVFNRRAGSAPDYNYSPGVKASTIVWTEITLDKWLTNPEQLIPGQRMGFLVPSAKDRADLIAYLKKETASH